MDGFICGEGSSSVTGTDTCPEDKVCIDGVESDCPDETFSFVKGLTSDAECIKCPPGKICPSKSIGQFDCPEGKYCPGGHATDTDPAIETCDPGHFCLAGSAMQKACEPGYY
jgi:hypothetical protein